MPPSHALGIDLGTSRAVLARVDERGRSVMVRDAQGDLLVPSVVFFEDDELLIGRAANLAAAARPARAAEFYKRDLGQAAYARAVEGELLPAEVVEACLMKKLLEDAARQGVAAPAVVLAMPASFNQAQRRARLDAARIAGLDVLGTLHDPLAAALSYAETQGYLDSAAAGKPGTRVLVFDLGAGKLDVAIVEIKPGRLRTMAIGGNARLGGRDWDERLVEHLAEQFVAECGDDPRFDMASVRRLWQIAEETKQTLSARQQAQAHLERFQNTADIPVTRQTFERLTADLLDQAMDITQHVLNRAGMAWRDVAGLLLIGGGSRPPSIAKRLEELTGLKPSTGIHADEAVARGAALFAESLLAARQRKPAAVPVAITDLTVHTLGVQWNDPQTGRLENVVLIPRGSELPCGTVAAAATGEENQSSLLLRLLEGESRAAEECTPIAQVSVRDLPAGLPQGARIDVRYQFTAEGRLQVRAQLPETGQALSISVRRENALAENQIAEWKQLLALPAGHLRLSGIQALAAKHRSQREAAESGPAVVRAASPPPMSARSSHSGEFTLETGGDTTTARLKRRKMTPRRLAIFLGGYLISAVVGTAIGYYILMWMDPSYNWWNLKLPGLREAPAASAGTR